MTEVCACFSIAEDEIRKAVKNGATTVEAVGDATSAGTGCGGCQGRIQEIIDEEIKS